MLNSSVLAMSDNAAGQRLCSGANVRAREEETQPAVCRDMVREPEQSWRKLQGLFEGVELSPYWYTREEDVPGRSFRPGGAQEGPGGGADTSPYNTRKKPLQCGGTVNQSIIKSVGQSEERLSSPK